jgi:hypothetical protein
MIDRVHSSSTNCAKVIAVDLIDWEDSKVIEGYVVEFPDRSHQILVGAALVPYSQAPI